MGIKVFPVPTGTHFTQKARHDSSDTSGKITYPMTGDPTHEITRDFGMLRDGQGLAGRATFIVDPDGIVQAVEITAEGIGRDARIRSAGSRPRNISAPIRESSAPRNDKKATKRSPTRRIRSARSDGFGRAKPCRPAPSLLHDRKGIPHAHRRNENPASCRSGTPDPPGRDRHLRRRRREIARDAGASGRYRRAVGQDQRDAGRRWFATRGAFATSFARCTKKRPACATASSGGCFWPGPRRPAPYLPHGIPEFTRAFPGTGTAADRGETRRDAGPACRACRRRRGRLVRGLPSAPPPR